MSKAKLMLRPFRALFHRDLAQFPQLSARPSVGRIWRRSKPVADGRKRLQTSANERKGAERSAKFRKGPGAWPCYCYSLVKERRCLVAPSTGSRHRTPACPASPGTSRVHLSPQQSWARRRTRAM